MASNDNSATGERARRTVNPISAAETDALLGVHPNFPDPDQELNRAIAEHQAGLGDWRFRGFESDMLHQKEIKRVHFGSPFNLDESRIGLPKKPPIQFLDRWPLE